MVVSGVTVIHRDRVSQPSEKHEASRAVVLTLFNMPPISLCRAAGLAFVFRNAQGFLNSCRETLQGEDGLRGPPAAALPSKRDK